MQQAKLSLWLIEKRVLGTCGKQHYLEVNDQFQVQAS